MKPGSLPNTTHFLLGKVVMMEPVRRESLDFGNFGSLRPVVLVKVGLLQRVASLVKLVPCQVDEVAVEPDLERHRLVELQAALFGEPKHAAVHCVDSQYYVRENKLQSSAPERCVLMARDASATGPPDSFRAHRVPKRDGMEVLTWRLRYAEFGRIHLHGTGTMRDRQRLGLPIP